MYVGNPWYNQIDGKIRNFLVETSGHLEKVRLETEMLNSKMLLAPQFELPGTFGKHFAM